MATPGAASGRGATSTTAASVADSGKALRTRSPVTVWSPAHGANPDSARSEVASVNGGTAGRSAVWTSSAAMGTPCAGGTTGTRAKLLDNGGAAGRPGVQRLTATSSPSPTGSRAGTHSSA